MLSSLYTCIVLKVNTATTNTRLTIIDNMCGYYYFVYFTIMSKSLTYSLFDIQQKIPLQPK